MRTTVLLLLAGSLTPCAAAPIPIADFERNPTFHAVGSAQSRVVTENSHGGRRCLEVSFHRGGDKPFALIQMANDPALARRLRASKCNGIRFWLRGDGSTAQVRVRLQLRSRDNIKDIRGGALSRGISLRNAEWTQIEVHLADMQGPEGELTLETLDRYVAQLQFTPVRKQPCTWWLDDVEYARVARRGLPQPETPGLELRDQVLRQAERLDLTPQAHVEAGARSRLRLNGRWHQLPIPDGDARSGRWQTSLVPMEWPRRRDYRAAWMVRRFRAPTEWRGKHVRLHFGAVRMHCQAWLNGRRLGEHSGAYTPFSFDASTALRPGAINTLVVYVCDETYAIIDSAAIHQMSVNPLMRSEVANPRSRGGIWQDVGLEATAPVFVNDIYAIPSVRHGRLSARIEISNSAEERRTLTLAGECLVWPDGNEPVLRLPKKTVTVAAGKTETVELSARWQSPRLWTPDTPNLYWLRATLTSGGQVIDAARARFGFREFWIDGGDFVLNGIKVRLRGDSHIASHSWIDYMWRHDYMRAYLGVLRKELGINAMRVHAAIGAPAIFDAADEAGIMLIDQSAIWSIGNAWYSRGGQRFLDNTRLEFAEWVRRDRNHPSVVIWDAENEMVRGRVGSWSWVQQLDGFILAHDKTRPVEHSGAGYTLGHAQVYHIHHRENYTMLYEAWRKRRDKPMVAGEWWVGGNSGERRLTTGEDFTSAEDFRRRELPLWKERIDEQRAAGLSGIMPFVWAPMCFRPVVDKPETLQWSDETAPGVKPERGPRTLVGWQGGGRVRYQLDENAADVFRRGLAELYIGIQGRQKSVWSGESLAEVFRVVVANDSLRRRTLSFRWRLGDSGPGGRQEVDLSPAEVREFPLAGAAPRVTEARTLSLRATLWGDGKQVNWDEHSVTIYPRQAPSEKLALRIFDPGGATTMMLKRLGIAAAPLATLDRLPGSGGLIVGRDAASAATPAADRLLDFVARGGSLLVCEQSQPVDWLPWGFEFRSMAMATPPAFQGFGLPPVTRGINYSRCAMILAPRHPVFAGLHADRLSWWRHGDGRVADDIWEKPSTTAVQNVLVLSGGARREYASLVELRHGRGRVFACQLRITDNAGIDPEATIVAGNLLRAIAEPAPPLSGRALACGRRLTKYLRQVVHAQAELRERAPESLEGYDVLLAESAAVSDVLSLRRWLAAGHRALVLVSGGGPGLPRSLGEVKRAVKKANLATVVRPPAAFAGLNAWDFMLWSRPVAERVIDSDDDNVRPFLFAHSAPVVTTGSGRGIRVNQMQTVGAAGVVASVGEGELILLTADLLDAGSHHSAFIWSTLLTNLDVPLEPQQRRRRVTVLHSPAPRIDGKLDDWLEDIEDRNVSRRVHARPMAVGSPGQSPRGLAYLLWSDNGLFLAVQTVETDSAPAPIQARFGERSVTITARADGTCRLSAGGVTNTPPSKWQAVTADGANPDLSMVGPGSGFIIELQMPTQWLRGLGKARPGARFPFRIELTSGASFPPEAQATADAVLAP